MYCFHLFLISSASTRSLSFLSFVVPFLGHNVPFLEEVCSLSPSVVFLCFYALFIEKGLLNSPCVFWSSAFSCMFFSLSLLFFASLLSTDIYKTSSDNHFFFLLFFFFGMVLFTASCAILRRQCAISVVLQALCLLDLIL